MELIRLGRLCDKLFDVVSKFRVLDYSGVCGLTKIFGDELAIVLQGNLEQNNVIELANYCKHWRELFPSAQIILSISTSTYITLHNGRVVAHKLIDLAVETFAIETINTTCDVIVSAQAALPLPPLKFDSKVNNCNLQIAAARAGLAHVTREHVLRIRSDIIFYDKKFIDFYKSFTDLPRGNMAVLHERVLISQKFTLNPYGTERIPYHFSDWFHFGRTDDVRKIWLTQDMSIETAIYFERQKHEADSFVGETQFRARYAVEQFIINNTVIAPEHRVYFVNDRRQSNRAIDYLRDNFIVADDKNCKIRFSKYHGVNLSLRERLLCISHADWRNIVASPFNSDYSIMFARLILITKLLNQLRRSPLFRFARRMQLKFK